MKVNTPIEVRQDENSINNGVGIDQTNHDLHCSMSDQTVGQDTELKPR